MNNIFKKKYVFLLIISMLIFTAFVPSEMQKYSKGYLLMDIDTNEVLEEYNADSPIPIASTTKLMSYILFREAIDRGELEEDTLLTAEARDLRTGSIYGIKAGEKYTVKELMKASLIISGNDATAFLARTVAGSEANFAKKMNEKAREIGLKTATFYNSTGLPVYPEDVQNNMSIRDLSKLSIYILDKYPDILDITSIKEIKDPNNGEIMENTNPLLGVVDGVDGLKTGSTWRAGSCLIWTLKTGGLNTRLLGVNMGFKKGEIRDKEVKLFADYAKRNYTLNSWISKDKPILLYVEGCKDKFVPVYPEDDFNARSNKTYEYQISLNKDLSLPFKAGDELGEISIIKGEEEIFKTGLSVKKDFKKEGFF